MIMFWQYFVIYMAILLHHILLDLHVKTTYFKIGGHFEIGWPPWIKAIILNCFKISLDCI